MINFKLAAVVKMPGKISALTTSVRGQDLLIPSLNEICVIGPGIPMLAMRN